MDSKMIRMIEIVIGVFVVVIIILFALASCSSGGEPTYTYEKLQEKMLKITKEYYKENPKELPSEDKDSKTYTLKKMISEEKLSEVPTLFNDENMKCDGSVTVTNNNGYYVYSPYLNCSSGKDEKFETISLADKIKEDSLVTEGYGLYQMDDEYYYRGEIDNNFVKFPDSDKLYRIVGINSDGSIRLIQLSVIQNVVWDNRFNIDYQTSDGINDYYLNNFDSRIKEAIDKEYNNLESWPDEYKAYITTQTLCIGKRSAENETKDGSVECETTLDNQLLGALTIYEILRASLDENCHKSTDKSCRNYNWFKSLPKTTWLVTADADTTKKAFKFSNGEMYVSNTSNTSNVYPVFNIIDKAIYQKGTGTENDPYVIYMASSSTKEKTTTKKTTTKGDF